MSLFQSKIYWSTKVAVQEEFDEKHLLVANIDNSEDKEDKIVVASFTGLIKFFRVQRGEYSPDHKILEFDTRQCVVQISKGRFYNRNEMQLCVLMVKKIQVF